MTGLPIEPHWYWLIAGVAMIAAEIIAPGFFLMWLGAAAIITGVVAWAVPIGLPVQLALFAVLAIAAVFAGKRWLLDNPIASDDPLLNNRAARMVGTVVTVIDPIRDGEGRVKVADGVWNARGANADAGAQVRVVSVEGATLMVEPV